MDKAVQQYPLHLRLCVVFPQDPRPAVTTPPPDVVLVNLPAPTECSFRLVPEILRHWPDTRVIFLSSAEDLHLWSEAIRLGAYDFLPNSVDCHQLGWVLQGALWTSGRTDLNLQFPRV